jgi:hypothetical protein
MFYQQYFDTKLIIFFILEPASAITGQIQPVNETAIL